VDLVHSWPRGGMVVFTSFSTPSSWLSMIRMWMWEIEWWPLRVWRPCAHADGKGNGRESQGCIDWLRLWQRGIVVGMSVFRVFV